MGLLEKLKSALGLDGTESASDGSARDVDVTVEREPSTDGEDAVKGTDTATTGESDGGTDSAVAGDAEAGDEAAETVSTDGAEVEDAETVDETAESGSTDDAETEDGEADDAETEDGEADDAETDAKPDIPEAEPEEGSDDPVTEIKGIGPAYAKRLEGIGVVTVGDLAARDAGDVASEIDLSESRVSGWIEQAESY